MDVRNLRLLKEKPVKLQKQQRAVTKSIFPIPPGDGGGFARLDSGRGPAEADRAIDAAMLSGVGQITFIHGKGTGALRVAVQQHLKSIPLSGRSRLGTYGEGESGVTIAELK